MMKLFAEYLLVRRLDSGGQIEHHEARRPAAPLEPARLLIRLPEREVRWPPWADPALARILVHPNIVQLLECRVFEQRPFAVLELVPGLDLRELISLEPLSIELSCFVIAEVCKGLVAALASRAPNGAPLRWVHGQLAPRAILLSLDGRVRLGGFGLGVLKPEAAPGPDRPELERLRFLAPEQVAGLVQDSPGSEVDVFQLGAILHSLLSPEPFFGGGAPVEYLRSVLREGRHRPTFSTVQTGVSEPLRLVLAKMLACDPATRFADAGELLLALGAVPELREERSLASQLGLRVVRSLAARAATWRAERIPRR